MTCAPPERGKGETNMIDDICGHIKNYFETGVVSDTYKIEDGGISLPFLQDGQYFRIVGSVFNDGVYQYPATTLKDEEFTGAIWPLALPPSFLALCEEIATYCQSDRSSLSPYTSESWGGYSYTKSTDTNGAPLAWTSLFAKRLNRWRKL